MKNTTAQATPYAQTEAQALGPHLGTIRIARVVYDHHPVHRGGNATIGRMIDEHIHATVATGALVSEVSLFFETQEQQAEVANMYLAR